MPIIAVFFGIVIGGNVVAGQIQSGTAVRLIREWAALHRAELEGDWANMKAGRSLDKIPPLE